MKNLTIVIIFIIGYMGYSQVGIGTPLPNKSAQLDVESKDRGVLIPRLELKSITDATTITGGNVNSLLVYNEATTSDLKPGYYYWFKDQWLRIIDVRDLGENGIPDNVMVYNPLTEVFTYLDENGNSQTIDMGAFKGPWMVSGTQNRATENNQDIYQMGNVGIGISKPTAKLHSEGTVRHQGLDESLGNTKFMTTDENGNVSLRESSTFLPYFLSLGNMSSDIVVDSRSVKVSSKKGSEEGSTKLLHSTRFEIKQRSMVVMAYNISYTHVVQADGPGINDGISKWIGMLLGYNELPSGSHLAATPIIGRNSSHFSSSNGSYVSGAYHFTGTHYAILDPGFYTVSILVGVASHREDDQGVSVEFGKGDDRIGIVAIPIN